MNKPRRLIPPEKFAWAVAAMLALAVVAIYGGVVEGGPLDPPAPPASTDGVRLPGTPISSLPASISGAGHYYLTRDLSTSSTAGLVITANDVDIDLNGFSIRGGASFQGIDVQAGRTRVRIYNGTVSGFNIGVVQGASGAATSITLEDLQVFDTASFAISLQENATLRNIVVLGAGAPGITVGSGSTVEGCIVQGAQGFGVNAGANSAVKNCIVTDLAGGAPTDAAINVGDGSIVASSSVESNQSSGIIGGAGVVVSDSRAGFNTAGAAVGIRVGPGSKVIGSIARNNGATGIETGNYSVVENSSAIANGGSGITVPARAIVRQSVADDNAADGIFAVSGSVLESNVATANGADGIEAGTGNRILNNLATNNGDAAFGGTDGAGIHLNSTGCMVEGNLVADNDLGIQSDSGNNTIVRNSAFDNTAGNYVLAADDIDGVLITSANDTTDTNAHYNYAP